jgi:hypothetical protein
MGLGTSRQRPVPPPGWKPPPKPDLMTSGSKAPRGSAPKIPPLRNDKKR